ncbi:MAG: serine hydrolase domain-containing protein [Gemmataceae bacterium]
MRVGVGSLIVILGLAPWVVRPDEPAEKKLPPPIHGKADPAFESIDQFMALFLEKSNFPGASLAMGRAGKMEYARAYGYAHREAKQPMRTDSLFRISSVSKALTAVAIMQLVERGKLRLDDKVFEVLSLVPPGRGFDRRWRDITVEMLLEHRGGWDEKRSPDPMFISPQVAEEMGVAHPAMPPAIIAYMLRRKLDFEPGEKFAYSNFGYCLLGRIIEKVGRQNYEAHIKKQVLAPLGIKTMRLGKTLFAQRAPGEVKYYSSMQAVSVLGPLRGQKGPAAYGGFAMEALDSHAGWIACAPDLLRFVMAFDDPEKCKILRPESVERMLARPRGEDDKKDGWYAKGWSVQMFGKERAYWHDGALEGSAVIGARRSDGVCLAVMLNCRDKKESDREPIAVIMGPLLQVVNKVYVNRPRATGIMPGPTGGS